VTTSPETAALAWCGPGHLVVRTTANGTIDDTRVGWTVGGGVETEVSQNWKARLEYRYTDLGHFSFDIPLVRTQTANGFLNIANSNAYVDECYRSDASTWPCLQLLKGCDSDAGTILPARAGASS
jgi:opacity protein-like surface antigen